MDDDEEKHEAELAFSVNGVIPSLEKPNLKELGTQAVVDLRKHIDPVSGDDGHEQD